MAMMGALKKAILGHIQIPISQTTAFTVAGSNKFSNLINRAFSSHDDHLTKDQVTDRVLSVIKDFPKVDPSKVLFFRLFNLILLRILFDFADFWILCLNLMFFLVCECGVLILLSWLCVDHYLNTFTCDWVNVCWTNEGLIDF